MFKDRIKELSERLEYIENRLEELSSDDIGCDEYDELQTEVYDIDEEIADYIDNAKDFEYSKLRKLQKQIAQIKEDNGFLDEDDEATLDMMYPNRDDDD